MTRSYVEAQFPMCLDGHWLLFSLDNNFVGEINLFLLYGGGNWGSRKGSDLLKVTEQGCAKLGGEFRSLVLVCRGEPLKCLTTDTAGHQPIRTGSSAKALKKALEVPAGLVVRLQLLGHEVWGVTAIVLSSCKGLSFTLPHSHLTILGAEYW